MRRLLLIPLFSLVAALAYGHTPVQADDTGQPLPGHPRISYATTLGTGVAMSTPSKTPFAWQVLGYYNLNRRFAVGAGTGLSVYEKLMLPVYGHAKFRIIRPRKVTPYLECGAGYAFALAKHTNGGFYLNPSIGTEFATRNKMKILFAVSYEVQKLEQLKKYRDDYFAAEFGETLSHHSLLFRIGVLF